MGFVAICNTLLDFHAGMMSSSRVRLYPPCFGDTKAGSFQCTEAGCFQTVHVSHSCIKLSSWCKLSGRGCLLVGERRVKSLHLMLRNYLIL